MVPPGFRHPRPRALTGSALFLGAAIAALPAAGQSAPPAGQPAHPAVPRDTLALPETRAASDPAPAPLAGRTVIIPTDEDRLMGGLADLLQRVAGVHVVRAGGFGDYVGVYIHGSSERQVNVYVNGVPQNPASDPGLFFGERDLSRVERIEVYKGLAPDHLPGSPMGGAVNIVTRDQVKGRHGEAAAGAGSFGAFKASGRGGVRAGALAFHGQAVHNRSDGDFPYYDDGGTEFQPGRHPDGAPRSGPGDLNRKIRRNNAHAYSEAGLDAEWRPSSAWTLETQADLSLLGKEVPSPFANLDSTVRVTAYRENRKAFWRGKAGRGGARGEISLDLSAADQEEEYTDTSGAGGAVGIGYDRDRNRYLDLAATLSGRAEAAPGLTIAALASYGISGYRYTDQIRDRSLPWIWRYAGEGKLSPAYARGRHSVQAILSGSLALQEYAAVSYTLGGRRIPNEDWEWLDALRVGYQYRPRDWLWFSAQGGTSYRLPSFAEKFGDRGTVLGNPGLRPERGLNTVAGAHFHGRKASAELRGFASRGRDIITLAQNSQNVLLYSNTGSTRILGLEASAASRHFAWSRSELDLTFQQALDLGGGAGADDFQLIPFRPLAQASVRQSFLQGGWALTAVGYYQGRTPANPSDTPDIFRAYSHAAEWQTRADLRLSWRGRHLLAAAGIDNVFDQRNFDFFNLPLPGRSLSATLQAGF